MKRRQFVVSASAAASAVALGCSGEDGEQSGTGGEDGSSSTGGSGGTAAGGDGSGGAGTGGDGAGGDGSGGDGSGGTDTGGAGTGGDGSGGESGASCGSTLLVTDVSGAHPHDFMMAVPQADLVAGTEQTYILDLSGHTHDLTVTAADFTQLQAGMNVTITSGGGGGGNHTHEVTVTCGDPD